MIVEKKKCTGCAACANICPKKCIIMKENQEGFLYPEIQEESCINCGLCRKICPAIYCKEQSKNRDRLAKPIVMAAYTNIQKTRLDSTSGGIFSELANPFLNNKDYVCGAVFDKDWTVKHIITNKKEDLPLIKDCLNHGCGFDAPGNLAHYLVERITMHAYVMPGERIDIGDRETYEKWKNHNKMIM